MDIGMQIGQSQRLEQTLSPQLLQSVTILQKTTQELETAIKEEVENNPLLELDESLPDEMEQRNDSPSASEPEIGDGQNSEGEYADSSLMNNEMHFEGGTLEDSADVDRGLLDESTPSELDWAKYLEDGTTDNDPIDKNPDAQKDPDEIWDRPQKDRDESLQDRLLNQLREWNGTRELMEQLKNDGIDDREFRTLVEYLINSLDDRGFLQGADDVAMMKVLSDGNAHIVELEKVLRGEIPLEEASLVIAEAIHVLQSFKPRGIGARNLQECFIIQAESIVGFPPIALRILRENFDDLIALRYSKIAKDIAISTEEVTIAIASLSQLTPHPGLQISGGPSQIKVADLKVHEKRGHLEVECVRPQIQRRLHLNKTYISLLDTQTLSKSDREYIQSHLTKAKEFIKMVDNRFSTMEQVMRAIVKRQKEFFHKGPAFLHPMILQEIADEINRDISTVSRVINGKFVDTPYGIYELKDFFTSGIKQGASSSDSVVGSAQVLDAIKKLVDAEDKKKPLSDQAIADALKSQGIEIARRTVAKYREEDLKILPARLRKKA